MTINYILFMCCSEENIRKNIVKQFKMNDPNNTL